MGNMYVYKIGEEYLKKSGIDKNSGIWELEKIKSIADKYNGSKNILVCVGGLLDENTKNWLENTIAKKYFDKTVYIMTDTISLKYLDLVNKFDLVLHQSVDVIEGLTTKNMYGYMPEMFFEERPPAAYKSNIVLFGGNDLNREEEIKRYVYDNNGLVHDGILCLLKSYSDGSDMRIDHDSYIKLLDACSFNLIVSRDGIYKHGWITSRMIEALSCNSIPLVAPGYDCFGFYRHDKTIVYDYNSIRKHLNGIKDEVVDEFFENRRLAEERSTKFEEILLNL